MIDRRTPAANADRRYRRLLRWYPAAFRHQHEDSMRETFAHEYAALHARGRWARTALWTRTIFDAALFGVAERRIPRHAMEPFRAADWRDALRSLRATPVITIVAILSLGLGTGANTALFSILNSVLYKPLPVRAPNELVVIDDGAWTNPIWEQIRDQHADYAAGAFAWSLNRFDISEHSETDYVDGAYMSGAAFDVLGVTPALGRPLDTGDDARGGGSQGAVVMLGYDFWQQRYGGASDVLGRAITIQHNPFTIVGVLPKAFHGLNVGSDVSVVLPLAANEIIRHGRGDLDGRSTWWLEIMMRLKPGETIEQATAGLNARRGQIREATLPRRYGPRELADYLKDPLVLKPAATGESGLRSTYSAPLSVVLVIVGVVLIIACANLANVLIARATARRHELSVRMALGATRQTLARQLLIESLMLAAAGAALGLLVAQWGGALLVRQLPGRAFLDLTPDWRVLGFTAGVALLTAVLFGVAPSLTMVSVSPSDALKERTRGTGDARFGLRNALVVLQVALSLTLVVGGALFLRTFSSILARPVGFDVDPMLIVTLDLRGKGQATSDPALTFERARQAVAGLPGVAGAALSFTTPIGNSGWNALLVLPDQPGLTDRQRTPEVNLITPGWFKTFGMHLLEGRDFDARDRAGAPQVLIVSRIFARKFLKPGNPIGQRVTEEDGGTQRTYEVVGVVEDSAYQSLRADLPPIMFRPLAQGGPDGPQGSSELSVRAAAGDPAALSRAVGAAIHAVDAGVTMTIRPMSVFIRSATRQERLVAMMSGFFGGLALLLAGIGLYGVTAYSVSRRRTEIGIRMALGAKPDRIVRMVLARAGWLVGAGVAIGAGLSLWVGQYVATLLYGVQPRDPGTLVLAAASLGAIALLAAWLPARRAARVDPTTALRGD